MHIQDGDQIVSSPHKVANIVNDYFVNIASTIGEPVDEEAQLRSDHNFCEWAIEKHKTHQSIISIKSQFAQNPQYAGIHGLTLSNISLSHMEKIMQNAKPKKPQAMTNYLPI